MIPIYSPIKLDCPLRRFRCDTPEVPAGPGAASPAPPPALPSAFEDTDGAMRTFPRDAESHAVFRAGASS